MAAIGSLVFCTGCGALLDGSVGDPTITLTCKVCGTKNKGTRASRCSLGISGPAGLTISAPRYRFDVGHD